MSRLIYIVVTKIIYCGIKFSVCVYVAGYSETRVIELIEALQEAGFDSWKTAIGTRGVTLHTIMTS